MDNQTKICSKCKTERPIVLFSPHNKTIDGVNSWCRFCMRMAVKRNYLKVHQTEEYKVKMRKYKKKYRATHKLAQIARSKVQLAIKKGIILIKDCETTLKTPCRGKLEAHHYLGYEGEHWKDILWLCKPHHLAMHYIVEPELKKG